MRASPISGLVISMPPGAFYVSLAQFGILLVVLCMEAILSDIILDGYSGISYVLLV